MNKADPLSVDISRLRREPATPSMVRNNLIYIICYIYMVLINLIVTAACSIVTQRVIVKDGLPLFIRKCPKTTGSGRYTDSDLIFAMIAEQART